LAILTINENPSISDTVIFNLDTPDVQGCFTSNPYKVDRLVVYYVERDFNSGNLSQYQNKTYNLSKLKEAEVAEAIACATPNDVNISEAKRLRTIAESNVTVSPFFFNEALPVHIVGNDDFPAWLSTDLDNAFIQLIDGEVGKYTYTWQPKGMREGDYFICWTWTPLIAGDSLSAHMRFTLKGDTQTTTSIPSHFTNPEKYTTLLDRYTPEMFKMVISNNDRTPDVLDKLNKSIALGFNTLEDLGNQIVDLQDANSIHEALIPYLSNFFDLKLKTDDPTRWRGQIKRAVPLYKMKGTKKGLSEALEHAAITMLGLNQLWEITSSYTWQEVIKFDGNNDVFELEKVALPIDYDNFNLWLRPADNDTWVSLSSDYVEFLTSEGITYLTWTGSSLSVNPIDLIEGDEIRVLYKYNEIPNPTVQSIENYIRSLPLMDQRDERNQIYPLKNWNVRVIQENDSMFDLVIPSRHPYHEFLVYGKVRTEFPYSENIYNMEEYNGSIRNSKDPCDIDRNFIDPCTACISSNFNIDLEIENLSDDRILEAKEVLKEYTPFHAVLHTFNFIGGVNEFIESPIEEVEMLISIYENDFILAGEGQQYFNRIMKLVESKGINRDELADKTTIITSVSGLAYNDETVLFCPDVQLNKIGMSLDGNAIMTVLSPSILAGSYSINNPRGNEASVSIPGSVPDTMVSSNQSFTFEINNLVLDGTLCNITQDNIFILSDVNQNFGALGVRSTFDVNQGTATNAWKVLIPAYSATAYVVKDVLPDGSLILTNDGTLPSNNDLNVTYSLIQNLTTIITSSGEYKVTKRGRVTALSNSVLPISNAINLNNTYQKVNSEEFPIISFVEGTTNQYYIGNYQDGSGNNRGDINNTNLKVNQKITEKQVGYLHYRGLKLQMTGNLESSLGIQNGANSLVVVDEGVENNGFKENFIVFIGSDGYFIDDVNGNSPTGNTTFTLSGNSNWWKTLNMGGTSVNVTISKYTKNGATIDGQQFDLPQHTFRTIDRSGSPIISREDQEQIVTSLSLPNDGQINEFVQQNEEVTYIIEYDDGSIEQGEI
jgi:hypothetical protein